MAALRAAGKRASPCWLHQRAAALVASPCTARAMLHRRRRPTEGSRPPSSLPGAGMRERADRLPPSPCNSCLSRGGGAVKEMDPAVTRSGFGDLALRPAATRPFPLNLGRLASPLQLLHQRTSAIPNSYCLSGAAQFIFSRGLCDDLSNRLNRLNHGKTHEKLKEVLHLENANNTAAQSILKNQQELAKAVQMASSFKYSIWSAVIIIFLALLVSLLLLKAGIQMGAENYAKTYLSGLLNDPDVRQDVQSVAHLIGDSIYERVHPWERVKSWWYGTRPIEDMAVRVSAFSFVILTIVHVSKRFEEDELLRSLEQIGMPKIQMTETIKLLQDHKFLKKEVAQSPEGKDVTFFLLGEDALADCFNGNMNAKIEKAVNNYHVFGEFIKTNHN